MYIGIGPVGGYPINCGPYAEATGRIMPFVGGAPATGTHIPWGYWGAPLAIICRGMGLGAIGMEYTIVGLGELTTGG